jgi:carotenoid cleavage dioxygenase-like enzyme
LYEVNFVVITAAPAWAGAIAQPAVEFPLTPLPVLAGQLPTGLRGSLYRNGPGRLGRGGLPVGHWFDGDGAILAVHFGEAGATGTYRYVKTSGYLAESEAGELLYGNYGMTAPGPFWNQWRRAIKNTANTSVIALDDRLLALWEGGNPHAIDLQTLKTIGADDLGGLESSWGYSAHPKQDPKTGEWFNFGISPGPNAILHLYRSAPNGQIVQQAEIALEGVPLVHDFALAGSFLVFCVAPVRLNVLPVLLGMSSFSDALEWKPELGTQIFVVDRHTLTGRQPQRSRALVSVAFWLQRSRSRRADRPDDGALLRLCHQSISQRSGERPNPHCCNRSAVATAPRSAHRTTAIAGNLARSPL